MSEQEKQVEKIVIHYKGKENKPFIIKDGLAVYTLNNDQDAQAEFVGIDNPYKIKALCGAMIHALQQAEKDIIIFEKAEKENPAKN